MRRYVAILSILLVVTACVPTEQAFKPATETAHTMENGAFLAADGQALPYRAWLPESKKYRAHPKAVILALHGFNDYSKAFESIGRFMQKNQIAIYAYDQRGFGDTTEIGIWGGQDNFIRDVKYAVNALHKQYPDVPLFLLGESMGSAITIAAVTEPDFPEVHGIILSAPAVWGSRGMSVFFRSTLWMMAHVMPGAEFSGSDLKVLASNNIPMLRKMSMDPLVIKKTRVDAMYGVVGMMGLAYDRVPEVKTPTLILYGKQDQVIPAGPVNEVLNRFTRPVTFVYYDWAYHMLMRDVERAIAHHDILAWILHPGKPLPSGISRKVDPSADRAFMMQKPVEKTND